MEGQRRRRSIEGGIDVVVTRQRVRVNHGVTTYHHGTLGISCSQPQHQQLSTRTFFPLSQQPTYHRRVSSPQGTLFYKFSFFISSTND